MSKCSYVIDHDSWDVEVEQFAWPPSAGSELVELHRLHKLGQQRPTSVPGEIVPTEAAGFTVTYTTEGKSNRNAAPPGRVFQMQFATLDAATAASWPNEASLARIQVVGGLLVRTRAESWTFERTAP
jgi:hypothetical protein